MSCIHHFIIKKNLIPILIQKYLKHGCIKLFKRRILQLPSTLCTPSIGLLHAVLALISLKQVY